MMKFSLPSTGIQSAESVGMIKFRLGLVHIGALGVFLVPFDKALLVGAVVGFFIRVFAWEGGSHRYFAHRAFKTSRAFQFFLAFLAAMAGVRGPLWWATHHRLHHRTSDTPEDPNTPLFRGRWYAYMGWFFEPKYSDSDLDATKDLSRYPELVWLNRYHYFCPTALMVATFLLGQYSTLFGAPEQGIAAFSWVFCLSTVLSLHSLFTVGSLGHGIKPGLFNSRRFEVGDTTTNVWVMSVFTMGASWHNNHHRCPSSARAGFYWWQIDLTYLVLCALSAAGLIWGLRTPPARLLAEGRRAPVKSATGSS